MGLICVYLRSPQFYWTRRRFFETIHRIFVSQNQANLWSCWCIIYWFPIKNVRLKIINCCNNLPSYRWIVRHVGATTRLFNLLSYRVLVHANSKLISVDERTDKVLRLIDNGTVLWNIGIEVVSNECCNQVCGPLLQPSIWQHYSRPSGYLA